MTRRRVAIIDRLRRGYPNVAGAAVVTRPAGKVTARGNSAVATAAEFGTSGLGMRSLLTGWNDLQPTKTATAVGTEWTALNDSVTAAHNGGYQLLLRVLSGTEHTPLWVYTDANPVPWVDSKTDPGTGTRTVQVAVAPSFDPYAGNGVVQGHYPVPLPWTTAPPAAPTDAQVQAAVDAAPLRTHYRTFLTLLNGWLTGPCPVDGTHTRATHIPIIPCTLPTGHGSEMTTSDNNPTNGVTTFFKSSVAANTSSIVGTNAAGTGKLQVAYTQAWRRCIEDHRELMPSVAASLAGGHLFGDGSKNARALLDTYGPTHGLNCVWIRTDFRQQYFREGPNTNPATGKLYPAFGGGLSGGTATPINFLRRAHELGVAYGIQTAAKGTTAIPRLFDGGGPENTDTFAGMIEELLSHLPNLRFIETEVAITDPPSTTATGDFFAGGAVATSAKVGTGPYAGPGWPGGNANAQQYLTGAAASVQSRL